MNKSIKRVVAIMLTISAFSVLEPVNYSSIMSTKAYADDNIYLKGINVTDGDPIILNSAAKTYITNVPNIDTDVVIRITTNNDSDIVTIDGNTLEQESSRKFKKQVSIDKGVNTFDVVVKNGDGDRERDYILKIDRGGKQSTDSDSVFLNNINIDFGDLVFSKSTTTYDVNVDDSVDELRVQANPENDNYIVKIDGIKVDDSDKFRRTVKLSKGQNEIPIYVEDDQDDTNTKTYTLDVYRGVDPSKTNDAATTNVKFDTAQDPIYLDDIVLDDGDVKFTPNFNKKITSYAADVSESSDSIIVKAPPEYDSNIVKINGITAPSDDKYRERVSLAKGKNIIQIQVNTDSDNTDKDYEKRIYTLTVYRGTSEGTSATASVNTTGSSNSQSSTNSNTGKVNQWININGKWQYNDSTGSPIKNTWYYDRNYGKSYYFNEEGNMLTGWLLNNGVWYYLDQSGAMVTGWKLLGANWYYLDSDGKMKTGWFKDINGKWYYLYYSSGIMAANTTLDGYKLGSDGAWIQ